ncbi:protein kinase [Streptomyces sp. NPDC006649]|uniref:WD40 repeat domain-containing serine/threonine protein kinase n=1 Tax=Streptomyces sp. NPDC006649 TaxID=3156896 RepID=UPI0033A0927B
MTEAFDEDLIVGRYRLVRQVGQGGMGIVWQALDEVLDRIVAIKQLTSPPGTSIEVHSQQVRRARREAKMAARLDHPGIVRVHDVIDWDGTPAIVMEFVQGRSLAARLRGTPALPVAEAVQLGLALLDALRHAHAAGVVHRDLKPDNILLAGTRTVITDFGIARPLVGATTLTPRGALIGTPAFMAPEQIEGREVTAASDLWSLGVTLYTAVEGSRPFEGETITELCLAILTRPMPTPRNAGPLTPLLETLLAKDPAARATAQSAEQMLERIGRVAVTPSTPELAPEPSTGTEVMEEPQPLVATAGTPTSPRIEPSTTSDEVGTDHSPRVQAPGPRAAKTKTAGPTGIPHKPISEPRPRAKTGPGGLKQPVRRSRRRLTVITLVCALGAGAAVVPSLLHGSPGSRASAGSHSDTPSASPSTPRNPTATPFRTLTGPKGAVNCVRSVAFSPDGTTLAVGGSNGKEGNSTFLWDSTTGKHTATLTNPKSVEVRSVAFSPNGSTLAVGDSNGSTYLWNTTTRKLTATLTQENSVSVNAVAFAPNGRTLAVGDFRAIAFLWDIKTGKNTGVLFTTDMNSVNAVAFSPNSTTLAVGDFKGLIHLFNPTTNRETANLADPKSAFDGVREMAYSPNGSTLAVGDGNGSTYLWNTTTRKLTATLTDPDRYPVSTTAVAFSPNGTTLAVGDSNGSTYLWNTTTRKLTATLTDPDAEGANSLAFSPNSTTLAVGDSNGSTYLWKVSRGGKT